MPPSPSLPRISYPGTPQGLAPESRVTLVAEGVGWGSVMPTAVEREGDPVACLSLPTGVFAGARVSGMPDFPHRGQARGADVLSATGTWCPQEGQTNGGIGP